MSAEAQTNFQRLRPSRRRLRPGDIFALQIQPPQFHFGRVIRANETLLGWPSANLVYLYRTTSAHKDSVPKLLRSDLILPPLVINRLPWSRGYFEHVAHRALSEADVLPAHCFRDFRGFCVNEHDELLSCPEEPCGEAGLQSFRTVDDQLSQLLGLPLAPD